MANIQSELLRISARIATEEPIIVSDHLATQSCVSWANQNRFTPGLKLEAIFRSRVNFALSNMSSVLLEITDPVLGPACMRVWPESDETQTYESPFGELFLNAFREYENRPNPAVPAGLSGLALGLTVIQSRDLLLA